MMNKIFKSWLTWGMTALTLTATAAEAAYKNEYRLSVVPGPTSGWCQTAEYFAELVRAKSGGRINIKVYPGAQLMSGKQTSEFMLLRNGSIDFALASTINWSPQIKELNLPAMPFVLGTQPNRHRAMDAVMHGRSGKMMIEAVEKKGVKFIGWGENGYRELTTSKGPITSPADLAGLKIRVVGSPIFIETFRALGANPVNINWSEATTGFQQGLVDGQENPVNGINITVNIWDYHKYNTNWHYIIDPLMLCATPFIWDEFTPEDRQLLQECAVEMEAYGKALSRMGLDDGASLALLQKLNRVPKYTDPTALMQEHGMVVTDLTPEQLQAFYDATADVRAKWKTNIGPELVDAMMDDLKAAQ